MCNLRLAVISGFVVENGGSGYTVEIKTVSIAPTSEVTALEQGSLVVDTKVLLLMFSS